MSEVIEFESDSPIVKDWSTFRNSPEYPSVVNHAVSYPEMALWAAFEKGWSISKPELIVAAAVYHGCVISLPKPARHHTILHSLSLMGIDAMLIHGDNQGFITSEGRYVNRVEAFGIAYKAKQIPRDSKGPQLFSEDLW